MLPLQVTKNFNTITLIPNIEYSYYIFFLFHFMVIAFKFNYKIIYIEGYLGYYLTSCSLKHVGLCSSRYSYRRILGYYSVQYSSNLSAT